MDPVTPAFGRRLLRAARYVIVTPLGLLALIGACSALLLGAFVALLIDCFVAGRSYYGR